MEQNPDNVGNWVIPAGTIMHFKGIPIRLNEDISVYGDLTQVKLIGQGWIAPTEDDQGYHHN